MQIHTIAGEAGKSGRGVPRPCISLHIYVVNHLSQHY
jgi:hypothetical protein